ncbi:hypothetical protein GCM10010329_19690 [Streptomyces spiroverticillatus]|uniref:N-acetyltransferase domain-containing protein n=1 Tax=Streptomyces finlayi TaxID=67296 RepID=A0A918WTY5_9ACTN|nr:hypothetical protein GCM10010329_19690 [Streptomyces spiroverticillatus]GHC83232.1 hypothetical protein GCM10010334_12130 [Streptomyces finlayi]
MELLTADDIALMQGLARKIAARWPERINADASYGELAWNWGAAQLRDGKSWVRRLWYADGELVAWAWIHLPRQVTNSEGKLVDVPDAYLAHQVHPEHSELVDEVISWYEEAVPGVERRVLPNSRDPYGLERWAAHGYLPDEEEENDWTQFNELHLGDVESPVLPDGYRFRDATGLTPEAVVRAHCDAWPRSAYNVEAYENVRRTHPYRPDLHLFVEAPDGTLAVSAIMWLDEANKSAEFEPVGTHPEYRRRGLARALMLYGMQVIQANGGVHMTVACLGADEHPSARGLYHGVGFRPLSRDVPMIKTA